MIPAHALSLLPAQPDELCNPARCALLIYDMQVGIVDQVPEGRQVLENVQHLLAAARDQGFPIFFTRHFFLPPRMAGIGQLRRSMIWQRQHDPSQLKPMLAHGSAEFQLVPELEPHADEVIVDKIAMSAFEGTFLNVALRDAHIDSFIIAGIALEVGIEPTVRHALDLNYMPILASDACGARTTELKRRSLDTLSQTGEVRILSTAETITSMAAGASER
ncbi:MAG TPA: cysteine hydrolase [Acidobacteriaceae bacterium]|jgi:nicotinamidase-related amidase|nr:cysteine hydrolase [Acidobacteriaceae bacterium]